MQLVCLCIICKSYERKAKWLMAEAEQQGPCCCCFLFAPDDK